MKVKGPRPSPIRTSSQSSSSSETHSPTSPVDVNYKPRTRNLEAEQEARDTRAAARRTLDTQPSGPPAAVIHELDGKSKELRQLSMTKSVKTESHEDHLKYVASQTDDFEKFATKRYPGDLGADRLKRLETLGPRAQELVTDPALMSPSHFDKFEAHARKNPSADPWKMRRGYEETLPTNTVYRGLTVKNTEETDPKKVEAGKHLVSEADIRKHGMVPQVNRTLDGNTDNIKRIIKGDPSLPALDEVHDKPIADVVEHRINAGKRFEHLAALRQNKQTASKKGETLQAKKERLAHNKAIDEEIAAGKERARKEVLSQSVSDFATAEGVTTEKLFNPQTGKGKDRIFEMRMPPLSTMDPGEYLPPNKVPAESMPGVQRKPEHEQITLTHIKPEQIVDVHDPKGKK